MKLLYYSIFAIVLLWSTVDVVVTASTATTSDSPIEDDIDLSSLTNEELEQICMMRGFELKKEIDNETGKLVEYSHEDYVEAARQCLDIEAEMEKIIQENPDILKEIEAEAAEMQKEAEKLQKEKEMLEKNLKEQEQMLKEKEEAAHKVKEALATDDDGVPTNNGQHENENQKEESQNDEKNEETPTTSNQQEAEPEMLNEQTDVLNDDEDDDESIMDLDETDDQNNNQKTKMYTENSNTQNDERSAEKPKENENSTAAPSEEESNMEEDTTSKAPVSNDSPSSSLPSSSPTFEKAVDGMGKTVDRIKQSDTPLLTVKEIALEFKEQVQKDFHRIGNIVLPPHIRGPLKEALKPAIRIGKDSALKTYDLIKRYTSIIFEAAKKRVLEEIQKRRERREVGEEAEDDTSASDLATM